MLRLRLRAVVLTVQTRTSAIIGVLLNRLSANGVPTSWRGGEEATTQLVQQSAGSKPVCTPEGLLELLQQRPGTKINMSIVTRTTSFGIGALLLLLAEHVCTLILKLRGHAGRGEGASCL